MMVDDIASLAASLTPEGREALLGPWTGWRRLIKHGLAYWCGPVGRERIRLRPDGLAVRAYLMENRNG